MRTTAEVLAYARAQHESGPLVWRGLCLRFVRTAYGLPGVYPSAAEAWEHAQFKHRTEDVDNIPRGVPVFWLGGSSGYGHVTISVGGGRCWTNDFKRVGGIDLANCDDITARWGLDLVGWTEDVNGAVVWKSPTPTIDGIIEAARRVRRQTHNAAKDSAMSRVIQLSLPYSARY